MGLAGIFDHHEPARSRRLADRRDVAGIPVEVNRHDRPRARGQRALELARIDLERRRVDVDEARDGSGAVDRECREGRRKRGRQDLAVRARRDGAAGFECERDGVGPGTDPDGVPDAEPGGELGLEGLQLRAEHVVAPFGDPAEGALELLPGALGLAAEREERDVQHFK